MVIIDPLQRWDMGLRDLDGRIGVFQELSHAENPGVADVGQVSGRVFEDGTTNSAGCLEPGKFDLEKGLWLARCTKVFEEHQDLAKPLLLEQVAEAITTE